MRYKLYNSCFNQLVEVILIQSRNDPLFLWHTPDFSVDSSKFKIASVICLSTFICCSSSGIEIWQTRRSNYFEAFDWCEAEIEPLSQLDKRDGKKKQKKYGLVQRGALPLQISFIFQAEQI